eukprot:1154081-Pelagomonas_calceolata.AAC.8
MVHIAIAVVIHLEPSFTSYPRKGTRSCDASAGGSTLRACHHAVRPCAVRAGDGPLCACHRAPRPAFPPHSLPGWQGGGHHSLMPCRWGSDQVCVKCSCGAEKLQVPVVLQTCHRFDAPKDNAPALLVPMVLLDVEC